MGKSKMYELAALSVLKDNILPAQQRLDIIRELLQAEETEKILERLKRREVSENAEGESN